MTTTGQQRITQATMALIVGVGALLMATFLLPGDGEQASPLVWILFAVAGVWVVVWTAVVSARVRAAKQDRA